jgi:hypothetical protein
MNAARSLITAAVNRAIANGSPILVEVPPPSARFKVVRIGRKSHRRTVLERNLTESEAQRCVARSPDSSRSIVCYFRQ